MPYMISSRSVTDGISLSLSRPKSKLVYSSLIFVDDKLTLICLLTQQQSVTVSVRNTQVIYLFKHQRQRAEATYMYMPVKSIQ